MSCTEPVQNQRAPQGVKNSSLRPDFPNIFWRVCSQFFRNHQKCLDPSFTFLTFCQISSDPFCKNKIWKLFPPRFYLGQKIDPAPPKKSGRALPPTLPFIEPNCFSEQMCRHAPYVFECFFLPDTLCLGRHVLNPEYAFCASTPPALPPPNHLQPCS